MVRLTVEIVPAAVAELAFLSAIVTAPLMIPATPAVAEETAVTAAVWLTVAEVVAVPPVIPMAPPVAFAATEPVKIVATAAAEAMALAFHHINKSDVATKPKLFVDKNIPSSISPTNIFVPLTAIALILKLLPEKDG